MTSRDRVLRQYHKWFSHRLNRDMELLAFGHAGQRVLVFPTRQGRFFDYENFGMVDALSGKLEAGELQLFCIDSLDAESLYCFANSPQERIARHNAFEQYVLHEAIPFTEAANPNPCLVAHGCSIGAYHAMNIMLRHPVRFTKVVALSGRYDLTEPAGFFPDLFQGYYNEDIYFHSPNHYLPQLDDPFVLQQIRATEIQLAVGVKDFFRESTEHLSEALWAKGIWHSLDLWPGTAHKPHFWREMVKKYF